MANLARPTKPGSDWTINDLEAYNIRILTVDTQEFFGVSQLPAPTVDPIVLNHVEAPVDSHLPRDIRLFFRFLRDFTYYNGAADDVPRIDDFSLHLLGPLLHFDEPDRVLHQREVYSLLVNTYHVDAKLDIALHDSKNRILFIQENRRRVSLDQAEPRLVAKALAAFTTEVSTHFTMGRPPRFSKTYIGIVMNGTGPRFYKINITQDLAYAVRHGLFPADETVIQRFVPPVPNRYSLGWGMLPLDNRYVCFQCFEALKTFL